jgi:hypothetical protein
VIPAGDEPISIGAAMMQDRPDEQELKRIIEPHLGRFTMIRMKVLVDGEPRDMFVDALAVPKDLPRNERATAIYREHLLTKHPHLDSESLPYMAGTAVLFEEPVWFD